jgi:hypothetical protein
MRKGQSTILIILGILIIVVVALAFVFKQGVYNPEKLIYPEEVQDVVDHVQDCVVSSAKEGVSFISSRGGYHVMPENTFTYEYVSIPYYYYESSKVPTLEFIESELNDYTSDLIGGCVDYTEFYGLDITQSEVVVDSKIDNNSIGFVVDYPLQVNIENNTYNLYDSYDVDVNANLGWLHSVSQNIVDNVMVNTDEINLDYLLSQGVDSIKYIPYENETIIYLLEDGTSFNGEENLTFMFATYHPSNELIDNNEFWESFI